MVHFFYNTQKNYITPITHLLQFTNNTIFPLRAKYTVSRRGTRASPVEKQANPRREKIQFCNNLIINKIQTCQFIKYFLKQIIIF